MKLLVVAVALIIGIPAAAGAYVIIPSGRRYIIALLIFSSLITSSTGINVMSMETYRGYDRGLEITLADILCLGIIIGMVFCAGNRMSWIPRNTIIMLVFWIIGMISVTRSEFKMAAVFTLWKFLRVYLVYFCITNFVRLSKDRPRELQGIWIGFLGIASVITIVALKQKYLWGLYRIHATFDHSNTIPLYLNMIIPIVLMWGLSSPELGKVKRQLSIFAAFGMLFAVTATMSRAGIGLAVITIIAVLGLVSYREPSLQSCLTGAFVMIGLLIAGGFAADSLLDRFRNAPIASEEARDEFNIAAQQMAHDHFWGIGLNNFSYVLTERMEYREHLKVMANEEQAGVAHHIYWLTAAELGYPGLVIFTAILLRFLWSALMFGYSNRSFHGNLALASASGQLALFASGFLEWAFMLTPVMMMFAVSTGLVTGLSGGSEKKTNPTG